MFNNHRPLPGRMDRACTGGLPPLPAINTEDDRAPVTFGWWLYANGRILGQYHTETLYRLDRVGARLGDHSGVATLQPSEYYGQATERLREVPGLRIIATDLSDIAIVNARKNAKAAGVEDIIEFKVCDFARTEVPEDAAGVVYMNPEYGLRLGEIEALQETYGRIGDFMKQQCKGYHGYVFTGNLELAKKIGLKAKRRIEFYNSTIDCRLLEYELYSGTRSVPKEVPPATT